MYARKRRADEFLLRLFFDTNAQFCLMNGELSEWKMEKEKRNEGVSFLVLEEWV